MTGNKKPSKPDPKKSIPVNSSWYKNRNHLLCLFLILLTTFICFTPGLNSKREFTNWDDPTYVSEQKLITSLDGKNIVKMFDTENHVSLNYHPVTMLSLAVNYHFSKLNLRGYYLTNVFVHLLNTLLVFTFIFLLSGKNFLVSALTSLFFGIHPMHVESVAWISERKDVLYCFFFLLSCLAYLRYLKAGKISLLILCFLLFFLSCLSKAMAVVLPLVLILIDLFRQRKLSLKTWLEKIPFLILSVVIGLLAIKIQSGGAIAHMQAITFLQRIDFACYGFMMYCLRMIVPSGLSAFYKYPNVDAGGSVPLIYQLSPLIVLAGLIALWFFTRKDAAKKKIAIFGMGFYTVTVVLVLQLITVGSAIMADRYSYVPYIGALFMVFSLASPVNNSKHNGLFISISLCVAIVFAYLCYERVKVWQNNEVLWTDVIEKNPFIINQNGNELRVEQVGVPTAHKNRGKYYSDIGQLDKAFEDYDILFKTNTADAGDCSNMGNIYALRAGEALKNGKKEESDRLFANALEVYDKGLTLDPKNFEITLDKGITYNMMGRHEDAIRNFLAAYEINPESYLYRNVAFENLQLGNFAECVRYCTMFLDKSGEDALAYFYRGTALFNSGKTEESMLDLKKSVELDAGNAIAWYNLSMAQKRAGHFQDALNSALVAQRAGYEVSSPYLEELKQQSSLK